MKKIVFISVLAFSFLLQSATLSFASSNAEKVLKARSLTEAQYLKQMPAIMNDLYGPMAVPALKLLWKNSGPVFAVDAVARAYGEIWALKGPLSVNERSLATVAALVAQGLYPQIKLHINGFVSSGGSLDDLYGLVGVAAKESQKKISDGLVDALFEGLKWREQSIKGFTAPSKDEVRKMLKANFKSASTLKPCKVLLSKLSAEVALGNMEKVREYMNELVRSLPSEINKDDYVDLLVTHLIVYCGYPRGMNAFNVWQNLRADFGMPPNK